MGAASSQSDSKSQISQSPDATFHAYQHETIVKTHGEDAGLEPLVIDLGSYSVKAGFAGDDAPRSVFPSIVGRPRHNGVMVGMARKDAYIGDEALGKRGMLKIENPIEYGTVTNWDDWEKLLHHTYYNELRCCPEEHAVLLTDKVPKAPKVDRETMTQIMFETFDVPAYYVCNQPILAVYCAGSTSGIAVDCGYQITYSVAVHDGAVLGANSKNANEKQNEFADGIQWNDNIGGKYIDDSLRKMLDETLADFTERVVLREIKNKMCYALPADYISRFKSYEKYANHLVLGYLRDKTNIELNATQNAISTDVISLCDQYYDGEPYQLPDGTEIYLNRQMRTKPVEAMFHALPSTTKQCEIHQLCLNTIQAVQTDIVLFGGSTKIPNIQRRFEEELRSGMKERNMNLDLKISEQQEYAPWCGGSILADLSTFQDLYMTKDEYDESGPSVVHRFRM